MRGREAEHGRVPLMGGRDDFPLSGVGAFRVARVRGVRRGVRERGGRVDHACVVSLRGVLTFQEVGEN